MTRYDVHIYREMRLRFDDIEADSPQEAAEIARDRHFDEATDFSDCEGENLAALVEVRGDEGSAQCCLIDFEPGQRLSAAPRLGSALVRLIDASGGLLADLKPSTDRHDTELGTPWTLHFDRDGTEDIAVIRDGDGEDLTTSRPFWLPQGDDPIPATLASMRLMAAAPQLLEALDRLLEQTVDQDLKVGIGLSEGEEHARVLALAAIALAKEGVT